MNLGSQADLYLDRGTKRLFAVSAHHEAAELSRHDRYQTLCAAAVEACRSGRAVPLPETARRVGRVDAYTGRVVLEPSTVRDVSGVWGRAIDRRELESVALEREADERQRFRRAVLTGDAAEIAQLGPKRHWRF